MRAMKRTLFLATLTAALVFLSLTTPGARTAGAASPPKGNCRECHANIASVLPKGHPPAKGTGIAACTACHVPDLEGKLPRNEYSARMHLAHIPPKGDLECSACHSWVPRRSFGLIGRKGSWGAPSRNEMALLEEIFVSWAGAEHTAGLHAGAGIVCSQCHGKGLPKPDETVENSKCLACHGPMDALALKTEPKDFKGRNPHRSHLGDIACTICHKGHMEPKVFCLDCHRNFVMKIPGAAKK